MSLLHLHASNLHAGVVVLRGIVGAGDQRALNSLQHVRQFRAPQVNQASLPGRCSRRRGFVFVACTGVSCACVAAMVGAGRLSADNDRKLREGMWAQEQQMHATRPVVTWA